MACRLQVKEDNVLGSRLACTGISGAGAQTALATVHDLTLLPRAHPESDTIQEISKPLDHALVHGQLKRLCFPASIPVLNSNTPIQLWPQLANGPRQLSLLSLGMYNIQTSSNELLRSLPKQCPMLRSLDLQDVNYATLDWRLFNNLQHLDELFLDGSDTVLIKKCIDMHHLSKPLEVFHMTAYHYSETVISLAHLPRDVVRYRLRRGHYIIHPTVIGSYPTCRSLDIDFNPATDPAATKRLMQMFPNLGRLQLGRLSPAYVAETLLPHLPPRLHTLENVRFETQHMQWFKGGEFKHHALRTLEACLENWDGAGCDDKNSACKCSEFCQLQHVFPNLVCLKLTVPHCQYWTTSSAATDTRRRFHTLFNHCRALLPDLVHT
jgi:hypothetical protein